jgi:DNA-directed RNA polymerase II subunit RPB2
MSDIIPPELNSILLKKIIDNKGGFNVHHIKTMNEMYDRGIDTILRTFRSEVTVINKDNSNNNSDTERVNIVITLSNCVIDKPTSNKDNLSIKKTKYPSECYVNNESYTGTLNFDIKIDITIIKKGGVEIKKPQYIIRKNDGHDCLILTKTNKCNLQDMTPVQNIILNEHPFNQGSLFCVEGNLWIPVCIENREFNYLHCFKNDYKGEATRSEYLAKPGELFENSFQVVIKLMKNGELNVELDHKPFKGFQIPFYAMFRLLGAISDKQIVDFIYYEQPDKNGKYSNIYYRIMSILKSAFNKSSVHFPDINKTFEQSEILKNIITHIRNDKNSVFSKEILRYNNEYLYNFIDLSFFCDIGTTIESRYMKMIKLGQELLTQILTFMGIYPSTDRDTLKHKNVLPAGPCFAKIIKTCINSAVINPVQTALKQAFEKNPEDKVDVGKIVTSCINKSNLSNEIKQAIKPRGDIKSKVINPNKTNKVVMTTELLNTKNKNHLYYLCLLNTVITPKIASKKDKRSGEIRRPHPNQSGYYCDSHTAISGESVGLQKNFAITAEITNYLNHGNDIYKLLIDESKIIDDNFCSEPLVILASSIVDPRFIFINNLCKIYINGMLRAYTKYPHILKYKYRQIRRYQQNKIHPQTSISYDLYRYSINFNTQVGRFTRLLFVVDNNVNKLLYKTHNENDYKKINEAYNNFEQKLLMTKEDVDDLISDKKTIKNLISEGKIEYLCCDELDEMYICSDPETFDTYKNNPCYTYTHVQLPASVKGLATNIQCYLQNNPAPRAAYQAAHGKQAGGWQDYFNKFEKELFHQYLISNPIISTISNNYTLPNGISIGLAIATLNMSNEEDGHEFSSTAASLGAFYGIKYTVIERLLLTSEEVRNPKTIDCVIDANTNYNGIIKEWPPMIKIGSIVKKDDALICIVKQTTGTKKFKDETLVYKSDEIGVVDDIVKTQTVKGILYKIKIRLFRPVVQKDKFSTRHGQKGIIGGFYSRADLLANKHGMSPVKISNPHAFPTRMTIAQLIEMLVSKASVIRGITKDGTGFNKAPVEESMAYLEETGMNPNCTEVFYNNRGKRIKNEIFYGPIFVQRIQKFAQDMKYSVTNPKRSVMTQQPTQGMTNDGGLKLGEMERDVMLSHGAMGVGENKLILDSDPFTIHICIKCNAKMKIYDKKRTNSRCSNCAEQFLDQAVQTSYTSNLVLSEMEFMRIKPGFTIEPYIKINKKN